MINKLDPKDNWLLQRFSNFTSSVNYKLLKAGDKGELFSAGGKTYIQEKAVETMTDLQEKPELEYVESLIHGNAQEYMSFQAYVQASRNINMRFFGGEAPVYLKRNEYSGGSPDGLMGEGEVIHLGLELKNPKNPNNHFKYLKFNDQWDLKQHRIEYYTQVQDLISITGAKAFHWVSYCDLFKDPKLKIKIIEVLPDQKFIDNLEIRIAMAQKEKLKIIESLNSQPCFL